MKHDSKSCLPAEVDLSKTRFSKGKELGIDFTNEIDVWAQMEFKSRYQIKQLRQFGTLGKTEVLTEIYPIVYGIRESLE